MLHLVLVAGSLLPLGAMLAALFAALRIHEGRRRGAPVRVRARVRRRD